MDIKKFLKALKLNESTISMILGAFIIVVVGVLLVNYFKAKDAGETTPAGQITKEFSIEDKKPQVGETYTVQEGETLWNIAEKAYGSGYNWIDIATANNLENPGLIEKGQELKLPKVETKLATTSKFDVSEELDTVKDSTKTITDSTYKVVKGDDLWNIAMRVYGDGYKWVDIAKANNLTNPNIIHSGNVLTLP